MDYIAFFAAIKHTQETEEYLVNSLMSYDIGSYLIVRETSATAHKLTNGDHYHFLVQMKMDDYVRFRKRVFLDYFKLKGRATKNCGRQYGKVNYLKDPDRMAVYMMKDDSVVASTFTEKQLEAWYEMSFKKSEQKGYKDFLRKYVDEHLYIDTCDDDEGDIFTKICVLQVAFNREIAYKTKDQHPLGGMMNSLTKAQLTNFATWYMTYHTCPVVSVMGTTDMPRHRISDRNMTHFLLHGY